MLAFYFFLFPLEFVKQEIKKKNPLPKLKNPTDFMGGLGLHPFSGKLRSKETGQITIFI